MRKMGCLFWVCGSQRGSDCHLALAETESRQRTGELPRGERGSSQGALTGGCWPREAGDGLSRIGVTYAVGLGCTYGFLCWSQVGSKIKYHRSCQLLIKSWPFGVDSYVS